MSPHRLWATLTKCALAKNCMFTWLTVLLKKIPAKTPGYFFEMMRHFAHHQQSCAYNLHSFIVYSCGTQPLKWDFGVILRKWKRQRENNQKNVKKGEREVRRRLNYYGKLSSCTLALKLVLHRQNVVLRSTVLMLMPWNILNWVFTNKPNGDKIRYEKKTTPNRVIWHSRR